MCICSISAKCLTHSWHSPLEWWAQECEPTDNNLSSRLGVKQSSKVWNARVRHCGPFPFVADIDYTPENSLAHYPKNLNHEDNGISVGASQTDVKLALQCKKLECIFLMATAKKSVPATVDQQNNPSEWLFKGAFDKPFICTSICFHVWRLHHKHKKKNLTTSFPCSV